MRNVMFSEWPAPSPSLETAFRICLEFEVNCETFDRALGGPCVGENRTASIRYARQQREIMRAKVRALGASEEMREAERAVTRMTYAQQCAELDRMAMESARK
jgi:hypothetical protein